MKVRCIFKFSLDQIICILVAGLVIFLSLNASAFDEESLARGGNMLPSKLLIEQFDQAIASGDAEVISKARDKIIHFASQPRRDDYDRLKLFQTLTEHALKEENLKDYQQTIAVAKSYQEDFGHYLNLHHFYSESDQIKSDIVDSMIWLAKNSSKRINNISVRFIWRIYNYVNEKDQQKTFRLLEGLYQYGFPTDYSATSMDEMYLKLISFYLQQSKTDLAIEVFQHSISDVVVYMEIWHDKRFQILWPQLEKAGKFDPEPIIEADLQAALEFMKRDSGITWSEWLDAVTRAMILYKSLGHYQQAIELALESIKQVPDDIKKEDAFFWLQNELANVYNDSGEWNKAKAIFDEIFEVKIIDAPITINGYINYALMLLDNKELALAETTALKIIQEHKDYTSDFGRYYAQAVLACVWQRTGRVQQAKRLLKEMNQHPDFNYYATTHAALCLQDREVIRSLFLARLNNPDTRAETLSYLSHYSDSHGQSKNRSLIAFRDSVLDEPEMRKVISQYGRTRHWFLPAAFWEEF